MPDPKKDKKLYNFRLGAEDKDIEDWLASQPNTSVAIRDALRAYVEKGGGAPENQSTVVVTDTEALQATVERAVKKAMAGIDLTRIQVAGGGNEEDDSEPPEATAAIDNLLKGVGFF